MGLWSVAFATMGTAPDSAPIPDVRWRLREITAPKMACDIDHRINSEFVMSPYPSVPWKFDWTTNDRTQGLRGYPLFEEQPRIYAWKDNPMHYKEDSSGVRSPGVDYVHAYWLARAQGLLSASE